MTHPMPTPTIIRARLRLYRLVAHPATDCTHVHALPVTRRRGGRYVDRPRARPVSVRRDGYRVVAGAGV